MPKNKGKGGKCYRSGKKNQVLGSTPTRPLVFKEDYQEYGVVTKLLGNCRIMVKCYHDDIERLCIIPGSFKKRIWINLNDVVLVGIRNYQDSKSDIIYKYTTNEVKKLIKVGEIKGEEEDFMGLEMENEE